MKKFDENNILARLDRLESVNRRLRWMTWGLTGVLLALVIGGAALPSGSKEIRAERIVLQDQNGKTRGRLSVSKNGSPSLIFFDQNQKEKMLIALSNEGFPGLFLSGKNERDRIVLGMTATDTPGLLFYDQKGRIVLGMAMSPDERVGVMRSERFMLRGRGSTAGGQLAFQSDGTPELSLRDGEKKVRVSLGIDPDNSPGLHLFDNHEKRRLALSVAEPGDSPVLNFFDRNEKRRLSIGSYPPDDSILMFFADQDENVDHVFPPDAGDQRRDPPAGGSRRIRMSGR